jgi:hypothetical protein
LIQFTQHVEAYFRNNYTVIEQLYEGAMLQQFDSLVCSNLTSYQSVANIFKFVGSIALEECVLPLEVRDK